MKNNARTNRQTRPAINLLFLIVMIALAPASTNAQKNKSKRTSNKPAFYSGIYRNVFREAGYSQADIDQKVASVYHELFEGPHHIYFEVGDSMGYVSDLKNHDARTEG